MPMGVPTARPSFMGGGVPTARPAFGVPTSGMPPPYQAPGAAAPGGKKVGIVRQAAGKRWVDTTLTEWPENDFRIFVGNLGNEVSGFLSRGGLCAGGFVSLPHLCWLPEVGLSSNGCMLLAFQCGWHWLTNGACV